MVIITAAVNQACRDLAKTWWQYDLGKEGEVVEIEHHPSEMLTRLSKWVIKLGLTARYDEVTKATFVRPKVANLKLVA